LRAGQILFTYLHLAADKSLTEALLATGVTGLAYETIEINRRLPLLEPMSEIAGRMAAIVCANCHAMIHRNNECRPMDGLVVKRRR
jgi:alanine dehydrogenase